MAKILNKSAVAVSVTRGDSATFPLTLTKADGTQFIPDSTKGEKITFTVRQGPKSENYPVLIQKDVTGTRIEIDPADTENLEYGAYIFDVEAVWMEEELETKTVIIGQFNVYAEVS
jgi:hypothetical protein